MFDVVNFGLDFRIDTLHISRAYSPGCLQHSAVTTELKFGSCGCRILDCCDIVDLGFVGSMVLLCHAADIPLPCPEQLDRAMPRALVQGDAQTCLKTAR